MIPFSTAWIADTHLAAVPVSLYAAVFMTVNVTYFLLCREVIDRRDNDAVSDEARRMMRLRSLVTIALFASASVVALLSPIAALAVICFCLFLYLPPAAPVISPTQPSKGTGHE